MFLKITSVPIGTAEVVAQRSSVKKVFLKITSVPESLFNKVAGLRAATL